VFVIGSLVLMWCALDSWNHDMGSHLFRMSEMKTWSVDHTSGAHAFHEPFKYTLTLAFLQFAFMGLVFGAMFAIRQASAGKSMASGLAPLRPIISDGRWPVLVSTHICGSVLLQSLMMPTHMMSLGLFAATRAVEIPVAAGVRSKVVAKGFSGPSLRTTMLMFAAAWLLFFSYAQIAECLCVWSGFGVALSGAALYFVYAFLLTMPASNLVIQESMLVDLEVNPILMLAIQNIAATFLFAPVLMAAHWLGFEDISHAFAMIIGQREVSMMVLWLCVQTAALAIVTLGLIMTTDSFWAVAARSARVVFWWSRQLQLFYLTSNALLSVVRPHASLWSLVMVSGIVLALSAAFTDKREVHASPQDKTSLMKSASKGYDTWSGV
jgi:hypothetical protein